MSIAFVQDQGLVKIDVSFGSGYQVYYYAGQNEPTTDSTLSVLNNEYKIITGAVEEDIRLLGDFSTSARVFYEFYDTATTFYIIIASYDSDNILKVQEVSSLTVEVPSSAPTFSSPSPASINFQDTPPTVTASGVPLRLDNIKPPATFITGASYCLQIVKVVNAQEADLGGITKYADLKNAGYKYTVVQQVDLASDVENVVTYDSSTQYKDNTFYTYVAFLYLVLGNKYGGWKIDACSSKITKEFRTVTKRDVDDLYVEDEVERIVAAQNANKFQTIATKKFPVISAGGGYIYSIMLRSTVDLCADENIDKLPTKLKQAGLIKFSGVKNGENIDAYGDAKLTSYQLSGIGKIEKIKFMGYFPRLDGTLKLSLSDK